MSILDLEKHMKRIQRDKLFIDNFVPVDGVSYRVSPTTKKQRPIKPTKKHARRTE